MAIELLATGIRTSGACRAREDGGGLGVVTTHNATKAYERSGDMAWNGGICSRAPRL